MPVVDEVYQIVFGSIVHIKFMRAYGIGFHPDAKQLGLHAVNNAMRVYFLGINFIQRFL